MFNDSKDIMTNVLFEDKFLTLNPRLSDEICTKRNNSESDDFLKVNFDILTLTD